MDIKFFQLNGPAAKFFMPSLEDTCWIPIHNTDIITKVDPPSYGSTGDCEIFAIFVFLPKQ